MLFNKKNQNEAELSKILQYQKALEDSEKRFRDIADASGAFIWEVDIGFNFTYLTNKVKHILGYDPDYLLEKKFFTITKNEIVDDTSKIFIELANKRQRFNELEMHAKCFNDDMVWLRISGLPIIDEDTDQLIGYRGAATDISMNKLQAVSLEQAYTEAEQAMEAKSRFLAKMSHEIRTPLNTVIGFSGLLRDTNITTEQRDYIDRVEQSGKHLLDLVNDILDYSKSDANEITLEDVVFNISEQIHTSLDVGGSSINRKNVDTAINITDEVPPYLKGDAARLRQILVNLIGNATKFTKKGFINISCSYLRDLENQALIRFEVTDTGLGIPEDQVLTLFDEFTQVTEHRQQQQKGTGLGLAISKQLVNIMGGTIGVESHAGSGSTFWFEIPFDHANGDEIEQARRHEQKSTPTKEAQTMRILVAEDSINNQILIRKILEKRGHTVNIVANGLEAVKAMEDFPYDLIFMDAQMPEMDGIQATAVIRNLPDKERAQTPIIALTADAVTGSREKYIKAGMDDYVKKPIDVKRIDYALNQWGMAKEETSETVRQENASSTSSSLLDEPQFQDLLDDLGKKDMAEAYCVLWDSIAQDIENLKTAIQNNDKNETRALAHKIKGTSGSFAAEAVAKCAYDIESNASAPESLGDKTEELSNLLDETKSVLNERLSS